MSCNHPMSAFWTGCYTENNKKEYIICNNPDVDYVSFSYAIKRGFKPSMSAPHISKNGELWLSDKLLIPCGHCVACKLSKSNEWKTRVCIESTFHKNAYFITLTYDDAHLPENGELKREDLKYFIDWLRDDIEFRYFACGEYGDPKMTNRPHYHLILMTDADLELKPLFGKPNSFTCDLIEKRWNGRGLHEISYADEGSIAYVSGYVFKKQVRNSKDTHTIKPFISCSDRPGLGFGYLLQRGTKVAETNGVYVNGQKRPVFRYIWRKLEELYGLDVESIKKKLRIQAGRSQDKLSWYFNNDVIEEFGQKLDIIYKDYLEDKRKAKL